MFSLAQLSEAATHAFSPHLWFVMVIKFEYLYIHKLYILCVSQFVCCIYIVCVVVRLFYIFCVYGSSSVTYILCVL